ncbi:MAG: nuclear transport factor 2 family protein [Chloroflexota bacterium]
MAIMTQSEHCYGRSAQDLRGNTLTPTAMGARAALETFYYAFNQRSLPVFDAVWAPHALIQLNNPLGGVQRGHERIRALYQRIFKGPAQVWVELYDIVEYMGKETAVFAGRERGEFVLDNVTVPLNIRTTRVFHYLRAELGWRQVHHHGSIDDADLLRHYQKAVQGEATTN